MTKNQQVISKPKIFNLSCKTLTKPQLRLSSRGLKFTPTPKHNTIEFKADIEEFSRKLRLKEFFHEHTEEHEDILFAKLKSKFCPPRSRNGYLGQQVDYLNGIPIDKLPFMRKKKLK